MFCKKCGTPYDPSVGPCPKCTAEYLSASGEADVQRGDMTEEEARAARKKSWIQLAIGIPAFIGLIYLLIYIIKLIKG